MLASREAWVELEDVEEEMVQLSTAACSLLFFCSKEEKSCTSCSEPVMLKSHLHEILAQYLFWANLKHCEVGFFNFDFLRGAAIYP